MSDGLEILNAQGFLFSNCTICNRRPVKTKWPGDDKDKWIREGAIKRHKAKWQDHHGACSAADVAEEEAIDQGGIEQVGIELEDSNPSCSDERNIPISFPSFPNHLVGPPSPQGSQVLPPAPMVNALDTRDDSWLQDASGVWHEMEEDVTKPPACSPPLVSSSVLKASLRPIEVWANAQRLTSQPTLPPPPLLDPVLHQSPLARLICSVRSLTQAAGESVLMSKRKRAFREALIQYTLLVSTSTPGGRDCRSKVHFGRHLRMHGPRPPLFPSEGI